MKLTVAFRNFTKAPNNRRTPRKTFPRLSLPVRNPKWNCLELNPCLRIRGQRLTAWAVARPGMRGAMPHPFVLMTWWLRHKGILEITMYEIRFYKTRVKTQGAKLFRSLNCDESCKTKELIYANSVVCQLGWGHRFSINDSHSAHAADRNGYCMCTTEWKSGKRNFRYNRWYLRNNKVEYRHRDPLQQRRS